MFSFLGFLIIGCLAGFLAGKILRGGGFGLLGNLVVGIIGAMVGGFLFSLLGIHIGNGLLGSLVTAVIGAVVLLWLIGFVKKA
ncbi:GlsB/YeaQ/YmgE family stress response membrane protein [Govanella unica]|uniref:GlsB/YeaQ/YmgE family stress response membrane protein n=1 Tax=Govanella unica TaxID=2975056 RepID=A0A9X3U195_9PROT|nr:GlsB/YeaQ/YmgE family stress response membrane protein [Govania unica]MDA5195127.1 GlsB/YeaQ/YmgE family stress response membrane protein [Govania unica]